MIALLIILGTVAVLVALFGVLDWCFGRYDGRHGITMLGACLVLSCLVWTGIFLLLFRDAFNR